jgi:hypothetical protein
MSSKKCSITLILQLFLNSQRTMQGPNRTTLNNCIKICQGIGI